MKTKAKLTLEIDLPEFLHADPNIEFDEGITIEYIGGIIQDAVCKPLETNCNLITKDWDQEVKDGIIKNNKEYSKALREAKLSIILS